MKTKIILFITAFLVWILLSWSFQPMHLIIGVIVGILVSVTTSDMFVKEPKIFRNTKRYLWLLYYIPVFIWECVKANIDAALRLVHPDLPINPGIVKVKTTLKSDAGLVFLANSLTLKPGTMTVDIDKENGFLYIHWSDVKSQDIEEATRLVVHKFERILKRIFE
ncbi:MAG: Na+/H+ antiporter subunit E [Candidatus Omnitrophica bacterium]|nr:Na+/H+ antiporter subunit E [Candidatus Omnitrophota bacterium]